MNSAAEETQVEVLSANEIRSHFPALERSHNGKKVAYFDGPGGTQVPRTVSEAVVDYLHNHNANTHWDYPSSAETDEIISNAREALAGFINASPAEIAFGLNMTTLAFHLSRALGRGYREGDEIVITELDHHANVAPWQALEKERGVRVRVVRLLTDTGKLDMEDLRRKIGPRTRLLAIGAASNAIGTITDVRGAANLAHAAGALVFVDAVHYAPHMLVDVGDFDCDFLSCSAYKFYGPHVGVLYGRGELLRSLDFPKLVPAPDTAPERVETGTQNHEGIAGAAAAVDFLSSLSKNGEMRRTRLASTFDVLHERGLVLTRRLWQGLSEIQSVRLYGPSPDHPRTPTISFTVTGTSSTSVARRLAAQGIFVSHGDFYALTVAERFGQMPEGFVRAGCACYTTIEEVERLITAIREIAA